MTQYAVRQLTEIETLMTSVERVTTYTELESETGYKVERKPPEIWPHEGTIAFKDVYLTYYPGGPQSLKNITLNINGGAKIGLWAARVQGNLLSWRHLCACLKLVEIY